MLEAVSNTSPLLYLHRIGVIEWLPKLFDVIWIPSAVVNEFTEGGNRGYEVPTPAKYEWLRIVEPENTPSEWLSLDLGYGEIAAMSLALENPEKIVLLDDLLARNIAKAAALNVWGTLRILLQAKSEGLTDSGLVLLSATGWAGGVHAHQAKLLFVNFDGIVIWGDLHRGRIPIFPFHHIVSR